MEVVFRIDGEQSDESLGEFNPNDIQAIVDLTKKHGCWFPSFGDCVFVDANVDLAFKRFEIIVTQSKE